MKSERKNVVMPADWWKEFKKQAGDLSLSEWIGKQCLAAVPTRKRSKLSQRITRGKRTAKGQQNDALCQD